MSEDTIGPLRKVLAAVCHSCPMCKSARERPESILGRILHHPLHTDHCPMWKAERELYGASRRGSAAT